MVDWITLTGDCRSRLSILKPHLWLKVIRHRSGVSPAWQAISLGSQQKVGISFPKRTCKETTMEAGFSTNDSRPPALYPLAVYICWICFNPGKRCSEWAQTSVWIAFLVVQSCELPVRVIWMWSHALHHAWVPAHHKPPPLWLFCCYLPGVCRGGPLSTLGQFVMVRASASIVSGLIPVKAGYFCCWQYAGIYFPS